MRTRGLDPGMPDLSGLEPLTEFPASFEEAVLRAAGNPEKAQLLIGFRVERREDRVEILTYPAGAEGADPSEALEGVEPDIKRFGAAHGQTGDGAEIALRRDPIGLLDLRDDFCQQGVTEFIESALEGCRIGGRKAAG